MKLTAEDKAFSQTYDDAAYWHPSVTADTAVFRALDCAENASKKYPSRKLELLLVKRGNHPYKGGWALPGGFCEKDETLRECAARECQEETGLSPVYCGEVGTFSRVDRDPRTRVMSEVFVAVLPYGETGEVVAADDAAEAAWFEVAMKTEALSPKQYRVHLNLKNDDFSITGAVDLLGDEQGQWRREVTADSEDLAFDHLEIICQAIEMLRTKMYRTQLAFNWVPEHFRIADLQDVFEAVIGEELLRTTFFEHVKPLLRRVDEENAENVAILDQMYRYNQDYCILDGLSAIDLWQA